MTNDGDLRLCGGTFFTLLLQARRQRVKPSGYRKVERDGLLETDMLIGLIKIFDPDYIEPADEVKGSFKTNTFDFKSCKLSNSLYIPLFDTTAFDKRIKNNYSAPLKAMCEYADRFIEIGTSTEKDLRLVRALLELIATDGSIADEQAFFIYGDGSEITKAGILKKSDICLQPFLLGIWHFVLVNRKDNAVGKATYDMWCPSRGGGERKYIGKMGDGIVRDINVSYMSPMDLEGDIRSFDNPGDQAAEDNSEPYVEDADSSVKPTSQTINNNGFLFQQFGTNNKQIIGNVETLVINND